MQNVRSANVATRWPRADVCTSPATSVVTSSAVAASRHSSVERFVLCHMLLFVFILPQCGVDFSYSRKL